MSDRSAAANKRIIKNGMPPSARKQICIDLDATLYPFATKDGTMNGDRDPLPGAVEVTQALAAAGWNIIIFTSRLSRTWWNAENFTKAQRLEQRRYVKRLLDRDRIPYSRITSEKVPATYYLDDRAIAFTDWADARRRILG